MRMARRLSRYIMAEILTYSAVGFLGVAIILLSRNLLRRIDEFAAVGFEWSDLLAVLACIFPMFTAYTVPVAFLFGTLVAFGRLSADSEVTAMRACGLGIRSLMVPPMMLALLVSALTAILMVDVEPRARRELRSVLDSIASRGALVQPGRFNKLDSAGNRILLVQARTDDNELEGVMIADRSEAARPYTVFAEHGRFTFDEQTLEIHLILENGSMHFEPDGTQDERYRFLTFDTLDYGLEASYLLSDESRIQPREMSIQRIREVLDYFDSHDQTAPPDVRVQERASYEIQIHRRVALPMAPIWFALIGVPLGIRRTRGARSYGVLVCVGLVVAYYSLLSVGEFIALEGRVPVVAALWLPNVAFAGVAGVLLWRLRFPEI